MSDSILSRVRTHRSFSCGGISPVPGSTTQASRGAGNRVSFESAIWWLASASLSGAAQDYPVDIDDLKESVLVNSGSLRTLATALSGSHSSDSESMLAAESSVHVIIEHTASLYANVLEACSISASRTAAGQRLSLLCSRLEAVLEKQAPEIHSSASSRAKDHPIGSTLLEWLTCDLAALASLAEVLRSMISIPRCEACQLGRECKHMSEVANTRPVDAVECSLVACCEWLVVQSEVCTRWQTIKQHVLDTSAALAERPGDNQAQ